MTDNKTDKKLKVELPITEYGDLTIFLAMSVGSTEYDGWEVEITTTGKKLILDMKKGEKRIKQSIELGELIGTWIAVALRGED